MIGARFFSLRRMMTQIHRGDNIFVPADRLFWSLTKKEKCNAIFYGQPPHPAMSTRPKGKRD